MEETKVTNAEFEVIRSSAPGFLGWREAYQGNSIRAFLLFHMRAAALGFVVIALITAGLMAYSTISYALEKPEVRPVSDSSV
jgi:hypothetical protein